MQTLGPSQKISTGFVLRSPDADVTNAHSHAEDPRWQLAQRIAASGTLGRSRLLADFLLYIVDRHIRDRADEITEQQLGVLVFGRAEGYDASEDNIVRSYARNLRKRLDEYFATEGKEENLLLEIPRGGYAPSFSMRRIETSLPSYELTNSEPTTLGEADSGENPVRAAKTVSVEEDAFSSSLMETPDSVPKHESWKENLKRRPYWAGLVLCVGFVLGLGCAFLFPRPVVRHAVASPTIAESHKLWTQLFSSSHDTFIVPSDDGLIIMQSLIERPLPLANYINGSYRTNLKRNDAPGAPEILKLGKRRYTSVVDLELVAQLSQLDDVVPERTIVRYARDLRMGDLRTGSAILIGSSEANPWIELFQPRMNFRFSFNPGNDKPSGIINSRPQAGENTIYGTPTEKHTYGLIAYVPNLSGTEHVLIVAGLNTAGTEAAAKFLLTPSLMMDALHRARSPHGGFEQFELLVGADNVASNAASPQLIAERIGPQ
ncbi:MAG: hypothetical protein JWM43_3084 [Acidobacteriaceae bacterium]|nr:hypothetical protein [Acidobacteriaceae bacterium]